MKNPGSAAANNSWHVAADWVEAFAPVIHEPVDRRLRVAALAERGRLDALREAGEPLERPQVLLLDDVPVYGRAYGQQRARRDDGFFILVAAEVGWGDGDPLEDAFAVVRPVPRLVRALADRDAWRGWWDDLEQLCVGLKLPRDKIRKRRVNYEQPFADVADALRAHPGVSLSTGGLETLIAKRIDPLLERRRTGFGSIERTNHLLDLVVALEHGAFDNLAEVAKQRGIT